MNGDCNLDSHQRVTEIVKSRYCGLSCPIISCVSLALGDYSERIVLA